LLFCGRAVAWRCSAGAYPKGKVAASLAEHAKAVMAETIGNIDMREGSAIRRFNTSPALREMEGCATIAIHRPNSDDENRIAGLIV